MTAFITSARSGIPHERMRSWALPERCKIRKRRPRGPNPLVFGTDEDAVEQLKVVGFIPIERIASRARRLVG